MGLCCYVIVKMVIDFVYILGVKVVVEGVEIEYEVYVFKLLGVDLL